MDRLLTVEPKKLILNFEVGERTCATIHLKNVMHTMHVAYMVQSVPPRRYIIKPTHGIIPPLGVASVEILLPPQSEQPESVPYSKDKFLVKSVVVPGGGSNESVSLEWFTAKKKQVFSDHGMRIIYVGGGILRNLVENGSMEDIREVLELDGTLANTQDGQGRTAMHIAVASRRPELVQLLLEFMADVEVKDQRGETALHAAASFGEALIVELLLAKGSKPDSRNLLGWTSLHSAVAGGHADVVRLLAHNGADVDAAADDGRTAVHIAVSEGRHECLAALLEEGAQADVRWREHGEYPLHRAALSGDEKAVKLLLEHGASRHVRNKRGQTPRDLMTEREQDLFLLDEVTLGDELRAASRKGKVEDVQLSLRRGALINGKDQHGWTALHCAAFKGHTLVVCHLLQEGADISSKDAAGYTPLHCAVEAGQTDAVRILLNHGASVSACNNRGNTVSNLAHQWNYSLENIELTSEELSQIVQTQAHAHDDRGCAEKPEQVFSCLNESFHLAGTSPSFKPNMSSKLSFSSSVEPRMNNLAA